MVLCVYMLVVCMEHDMYITCIRLISNGTHEIKLTSFSFEWLAHGWKVTQKTESVAQKVSPVSLKCISETL